LGARRGRRGRGRRREEVEGTRREGVRGEEVEGKRRRKRRRGRRSGLVCSLCLPPSLPLLLLPS
jgi:hypothetical protein